uniref:Uncharacterized protein n=1 Tax=Arundo donax TaxID=35708 RepID=A0A0A9CWY6_ARUDO
MRVQWVELQQSWSSDSVPHSSAKSGLLLPILVDENGAYKNQVRIRCPKNPLPIKSYIDMSNWRAQPWKSCLRHPHRAF